MASLGDLVVKIGADTRDLNKQLGKVQREVRGMTSNITQLGQNLTRSITLPLAALGAAAVKSAADLETLETSFISLTGGAKQARDMVADLNKFTAETPFQLEAVGKAARQLIAAGTDISQVNTQLQFLGDIAATSGSSIDEIAAIFAKVQAKGKVELENLNQLAERNIPIFTALAEATGLPASKLGAGAVSIKQFNATLKSFAEAGGFAEGAMKRLSQTAAGKLSTAIDNLKLAGASLANDILPKITAALDKVTGAAQGFTRLDPDIKGLIVNFGLLSAAIGPVIAVLPQLTTQLKAIMSIIGGGGVGIAVAAVAGLITTFATLRKETTTIQDRLNKTQREANKAAAKSIADVRVLVTEYGKENTELERKESILRTLRNISPQYYGDLKDATVTVQDLTAATQEYTRSIKENARQIAVQEAQQEQLKAIADRQRDLLNLEQKRAEILAKYDKNMDGIISVHEAAEASAESFFAAFDIETFNVLGGKIQATEADIERMSNELLKFEETFRTVGTTVDENGNKIEKVGQTFDSNGETVDTTAEKYDNLTFHINEAAHAITDFSAENLKAKGTLDDLFRMLTNTEVQSVQLTTQVNQMGVAMVNAFTNAASSAQSFAGFAVEAIKGVIIAYLAEAKTRVIANSAEAAAGTGPAYPFVMAGMIGAGMALINKIPIPALAEGGLASGPTMAIVGDNRNAAIDPEVISPLSKLKDMMGGSQVEVFGRISGNDIFLSNSRSGFKRNRYS
jgi:tape measure domain-containing protein